MTNEAETPQEPEQAPIQLPEELFANLQDGEAQKETITRLQNAVLQGFFWARGLGAFDPTVGTVTAKGELVRVPTKE